MSILLVQSKNASSEEVKRFTRACSFVIDAWAVLAILTLGIGLTLALSFAAILLAWLTMGPRGMVA